MSTYILFSITMHYKWVLKNFPSLYIYNDKGGDSARNSPKNEPKTIDKNPFFAPRINQNEILSETAYVNQRFLPYFGREASRETLFRAKKSKKVSPKIAQNHSCRGYPETLPRSLDKFGDYGGATRDSSPVTEHITRNTCRSFLAHF